jgi:hypothetical protein
MGPRVFSISQQELASVCNTLRRVYSVRPEVRTQLDKNGRLLLSLLAIWLVLSALGTGWHYMLAQAVTTGPLASEPTWVDEDSPGWKVGETHKITLPTGQLVRVQFKGKIPAGVTRWLISNSEICTC